MSEELKEILKLTRQVIFSDSNSPFAYRYTVGNSFLNDPSPFLDGLSLEEYILMEQANKKIEENKEKLTAKALMDLEKELI